MGDYEWDICETDVAVWHQREENDAPTTLNQYDIVEKIGKGSFGVVNKCFRIEEGSEPRPFAMKTMNKRTLSRIRTTVYDAQSKRMSHKSGLDAIHEEIAIWRHLYHRNIPLLFEVIDDPDENELVYIMELMQYGPVMRLNEDEQTFRYYKSYYPLVEDDEETPHASVAAAGALCDQHAEEKRAAAVSLVGAAAPRSEHCPHTVMSFSSVPLSHVNGSVRMTEERAAYHFYELMQAVEYLHSRGIVHRDIKPDNLLVNDRHMVCLCDFNSAQQFDISGSDRAAGMLGLVSDTVGTPAFWAPESIKKEFGLRSCPQNKESSPVTSRCNAGRQQDTVFSATDNSSDEEGDERLVFSAFHADIWAAGVSLYCFVYNVLPFQHTRIPHVPKEPALESASSHGDETPQSDPLDAKPKVNTATCGTSSLLAGTECVDIESDVCFDDAGGGAADGDDDDDRSPAGGTAHSTVMLLMDRICNVEPILANYITVNVIGSLPTSTGKDDKLLVLNDIQEGHVSLSDFGEQSPSQCTVILSSQFLDLIEKMLRKHTHRRLNSVDDVLKHPWLQHPAVMYNERHSDVINGGGEDDEVMEGGAGALQQK